MSYRIKLKSFVWNRETNILFDFESGDFYENVIMIKDKGCIVKDKKTVSYEKISTSLQRVISDNKVANIDVNKERLNFFLKFDKTDNLSDNKGWIVIKSTFSLDEKGYRIKIGDIIKLGKVVFQVRDINIEGSEYYKKQKSKGENKSNFENQGKIKTNINYNNTTSNEMLVEKLCINKNQLIKLKANQICCRVCLSEEYDLVNPLINPCKCSGTMKFIHLNCLKEWMKTKVDSKSSENQTIFKIKPLECELCMEIIPDQIKFKDQIYSTIDIEMPKGENYITFENVRKLKTNKKYVYIIKMKGKDMLTMGRSNNCDITLSDVSVSKNHSRICLIGGALYLQDDDSKFGTLAEIQSDIFLLPYKSFCFQFHNAVFFLKLKKNFFSCLLCCEKLKYIDYNDYIDENIKMKSDATSFEMKEKDFLSLDHQFQRNDTIDDAKKSEKKKNIQFIEHLADINEKNGHSTQVNHTNDFAGNSLQLLNNNISRDQIKNEMLIINQNKKEEFKETDEIENIPKLFLMRNKPQLISISNANNNTAKEGENQEI